MLSFFPPDVLDGVLGLVGSVSGGLPSCSFRPLMKPKGESA